MFALRQSLAAQGHGSAVRKKRIRDEKDADERQRGRKKESLKAREAQPERVGMQQQATRAATRRLRTCSLLFPARPPSSLPAGVMQVASPDFRPFNLSRNFR